MTPDGERHGWVAVRPPDGRAGVVRLAAGGRFDPQDLDRLADALRAAVTAGSSLVELEVDQVAFADTSLVRVLLEARRLAAASRCAFRVLHPTGRTAMVLDVTGTRAMLCGPGPGVGPGPAAPALPWGPALDPEPAVVVPVVDVRAANRGRFGNGLPGSVRSAGRRTGP